MRKLFFLFLLVIVSFTVFAQDNIPVDLEVISSTNLDRIQELAHWESAESDVPVAATFSPDGTILALSLNDGTIQLIDTTTFLFLRVFQGVDTLGGILQFNSSGTQLLLWRNDGVHILWDVESGERLIYQSEALVRGRFGVSNDFSKYLLFSYDDKTASVRDFQTGEELLEIPHENILVTPKLNDDGSVLLTQGARSEVKVWDIESGELKFQLTPQWDSSDSGELYGMGFTPDGNVWSSWQRLFKAGEATEAQSVIQFWDIDDAQLLKSFDGLHWYEELYFDPTRKYFAAVGTRMQWGASIPLVDGTIWIWDIEEAKEVGVPQGATGGVSLVFSPNGTLYAYSGGTSPTIIMYEIGVDRPRRTALTASNLLSILGAGSIQFSPDGKLFIHAGLDVHVWGVPSNNE